MPVYTIHTRSSEIPDYPYSTKEYKLLPSIIFEETSNVEPIVSVSMIFSNAEFASLGTIFMPIGISRYTPSSNTVIFSGPYANMKLLFDQGNGYSRLYLNYNNSTTEGSKYFKPFSITVSVSDNQSSNITSAIWQWTPPIEISQASLYEYGSELSILQNPPQISISHENTVDEWDFDIWFPIFDTQNKNIGTFQILSTNFREDGYDDIYPFYVDDSVGVFNTYGQYHGMIGRQCEFFYRINESKIIWWSTSIQDYHYRLKTFQELTARTNIYNEPLTILHAIACENKLFVVYADVKNIIDIFKYDTDDETLTLQQSITLPSNKWIHNSAIIDGQSNQPSIYAYNNSLLVFCGYNNQNYVLEYIDNGNYYDSISTIILPHMEYRGIYWSTSEFFGYITHNTNINNQRHITNFSVWKKVLNVWSLQWEITTPSEDTPLSINQTGISPFQRIIMSANSDEYFIHYLNNSKGELVHLRDNQYITEKVIDRPYPEYNTNSIKMYWDALFYNHPDPLGLGPEHFGYKTGNFDNWAWEASSNNFMTQTRLVEDPNKEHGWVTHWIASPENNTVFKYGLLPNVFWGSTKKGSLRKVNVSTINKVLRNFAFTPNTDWTSSSSNFQTSADTFTVSDNGLVIEDVYFWSDCGYITETIDSDTDCGFIYDGSNIVSIIGSSQDIPIFWILRNKHSEEIRTGGWFLWKRSI
jgi:hypothetical protein